MPLPAPADLLSSSSLYLYYLFPAFGRDRTLGCTAQPPFFLLTFLRQEMPVLWASPQHSVCGHYVWLTSESDNSFCLLRVSLEKNMCVESMWCGYCLGLVSPLLCVSLLTHPSFPNTSLPPSFLPSKHYCTILAVCCVDDFVAHTLHVAFIHVRCSGRCGVFSFVQCGAPPLRSPPRCAPVCAFHLFTRYCLWNTPRGDISCFMRFLVCLIVVAARLPVARGYTSHQLAILSQHAHAASITFCRLSLSHTLECTLAHTAPPYLSHLALPVCSLVLWFPRCAIPSRVARHIFTRMHLFVHIELISDGRISICPNASGHLRRRCDVISEHGTPGARSISFPAPLVPLDCLLLPKPLYHCSCSHVA